MKREKLKVWLQKKMPHITLNYTLPTPSPLTVNVIYLYHEIICPVALVVLWALKTKQINSTQLKLYMLQQTYMYYRIVLFVVFILICCRSTR
jgi:hypothetical protein